MKKHIKKHARKHKIKYFVGFFVALAMLFMSQTTILIPKPKAELSLNTHPRSIHIGDTATVTVTVDANSPINAVEGGIYLPETVTLLSLSTDDSIIDLWTETPAEGGGGIRFGGGSLAPGGFIGKGVIFSFKIRADATGELKLFFDSPEVLAHDGRGTDILSRTTPLTMSITKPPAPLLTAGGGASLTSPRPILTLPDLSRMSVLMWGGGYESRYDLDGNGKITINDISIGLVKVLR